MVGMVMIVDPQLNLASSFADRGVDRNHFFSKATVPNPALKKTKIEWLRLKRIYLGISVPGLRKQ